MKRLALVAVLATVAACSKAETPAADTSTPAMAPAPMAMDSVARADSIRRADSVRADSVRRADSTKAAASKTKGKRP